MNTRVSTGNTVPGDGATFCGQGYTACTGRSNYDRQGKKHQVDLVNDPGLIMRDHELSAAVMIEGMLDGDFTGKSLHDCMKNGKFDAIAARRIINGYTKPRMINGVLQKRPVARKIKRHYQRFLTALNKANILLVSDNLTQPLPDKIKRAGKSRTILGGGSVLAGVSAAAPLATELVEQFQSKATEVISAPVASVTKLAEASKVATEKTGEVIENVSGLAALFGFSSAGYTQFLFWALMVSLAVIATGGGLAIYARWDDLNSGKNP